MTEDERLSEIGQDLVQNSKRLLFDSGTVYYECHNIQTIDIDDASQYHKATCGGVRVIRMPL